MSDRVMVYLALPVDLALPPDVQGISARRHAINMMSEVAVVDENTVRYKGFTDTATMEFDDGLISLWQHNLVAFQFIADGKALPEVTDPITHHDKVTRVRSKAVVVRNGYEVP